jgi:ketosteroid isomerase-like protein
MNKHSRAKLLSVVLCTSIAVLLAAGTQAQAQTAEDPAQTVAEFIERVETGDIDGALELLTDDVVIVFPPCVQNFGPEGCVGKEQAAIGLLKAFEAEGHITVLDESVSGTTVIQRQEVTSLAISAAGVERIIFGEVTWALRDGRIARQVSVPDASDAQTGQFLAAIARMRPPSTGDAGLVNDASKPQVTLGVLLLAAAAGGSMLSVATAWRRKRGQSNG